MTKEEIIDYVLNSPENTNPNVLKGMLDQLGGSSEGDLRKELLYEGHIENWNNSLAQIELSEQLNVQESDYILLEIFNKGLCGTLIINSDNRLVSCLYIDNNGEKIIFIAFVNNALSIIDNIDNSSPTDFKLYKLIPVQ